MPESEADTITPAPPVKRPASPQLENGVHGESHVYPGEKGTGDGFLSGGGVPQRNFVLLSLGKLKLAYIFVPFLEKRRNGALY